MSVIIASTQDKNFYADGRNERAVMNSFLKEIINSGQPEAKTNYMCAPNNMIYGVNIALNNSKEIFISNHSNACNGKSTGTQIYYHYNSNDGYQLAMSLKNILKKYIPDRNIAIIKDNQDYTGGFYELRETPQTAILIEWFFHDNLGDIKWWEHNKQLCLKVICELAGLETPKQKLLTLNDICYECLIDGNAWRDKFASLGKEAEKAIQKIYYRNKNL